MPIPVAESADNSGARLMLAIHSLMLAAGSSPPNRAGFSSGWRR